MLDGFVCISTPQACYAYGYMMFLMMVGLGFLFFCVLYPIALGNRNNCSEEKGKCKKT